MNQIVRETKTTTTTTTTFAHPDTHYTATITTTTTNELTNHTIEMTGPDISRDQKGIGTVNFNAKGNPIELDHLLRMWTEYGDPTILTTITD